MTLRPPHPRRHAFTLIELLVVMAIIVLVIAVSIPLFNVFTGARSVESAQNQIGAFLNSTRNDAIGLQRPAGIMFYINPQTPDRINLVSVFATEPQPGDNLLNNKKPPEVMLDTYADRDSVTLPTGVSAQMLNSSNIGVTERYIGYNPFNGSINIGGVILFDGHGQLTSITYGLRTQMGNRWTAMGRLAFNIAPTDQTTPLQPNIVPLSSGGLMFLSQIGFVAFDAQTFQNQSGFNNADFGGSETAEETWIDSNSIPFLVNRYNGTLIRGE